MNSQAKQSGNNQKAALERNLSEIQNADFGKVTNFGLEEENEDSSNEEIEQNKKVKSHFALSKNEYIFLKSEGIFLQMKQKISETKYLFRSTSFKSPS